MCNLIVINREVVILIILPSALAITRTTRGIILPLGDFDFAVESQQVP